MYKKNFVIFFSLIFFSNFISCKTAPAEFIVSSNEKNITPIIVLPNKPKNIEQKAANFFIENYKKLNNINLAIVNETQAITIVNKPLVYIGNTDFAKTLLLKQKIKWDGYAFEIKENKVIIFANEGMGLLYGVNAFFERYAAMFYIDSQEVQTSKNKNIIVTDKQFISNPDFIYRGVYFPQASDYYYNTWHGTQTLEEKWAIWGHNLNKLVSGKIVGNDNSIYALINGKRNDAQYCLSSDKLYMALEKGIQTKLEENPDATYYSITANDNNLICQCNLCQKINNGKQSASNSVYTLVKKLAEKFPNLFFTSLAYSTTQNVPTAVMPKNVAVLISTIDYPKGISIAESKQKQAFETWVSNWKKVSQHIFVWDYAVQYTNYFDVFPNLPSLQKDLQFFKKIGITGVFEQGSGDTYSLFAEYKSYVISKLLWNVNTDIEKLKYEFFDVAYPTLSNSITDFITLNEQKLANSKKTLDIYGSFAKTTHDYLPISDFDLFFYEISEKGNEVFHQEKIRYEKMMTALLFNKLEILRHEGFSNNGYATVNAINEVSINTEAPLLLERLQLFSQKTAINTYTETNDAINEYCNYWKDNILNPPYKNQIINQPIKILSAYDDSFIGNPSYSFTNGTIGFTDYTTNWLVATQNMEFDVENTKKLAFKNISLHFLKDAKHYILLPEKIEIYGINNNTKEKIAETTLINTSVFKPEVKNVTLALNDNKIYTKIKIIAIKNKNIPEWLPNTSRQTTIACDEILLQ